MRMALASGSILTTHVLNTANGIPAAHLSLSIHRAHSDHSEWNFISTGITNSDGRCFNLLTSETFTPGIYKIRFETGDYWSKLGEVSFYPYVEIIFNITDPTQKYHLPLLISRFSYSTYRGS
ncbi:5-hydroxyisourate hydrolase b [Polypterus senegalus]|uniref:5-hydroxyisourate hydrolase b n=1 Tax=Polypterus senegalus TaxID=55291 RepID=UPI0019628993|nr:5-hydroxyisourate hydrolase b [Polypterus senegalus]